MPIRTLFTLLLALVVIRADARADEVQADSAPLLSVAEEPVLPGGALRSFVAARRALELGFPSTAAGIYSQLLASPQVIGAARNLMVLELVSARLNEGRTEEAERALQAYVGTPTAGYWLRSGLIAVRRKRVDAARAALSAARVEELVVAERAWWSFLQGQVADAGGDFAKARDAYQRAADAAVSEVQRAHLVLAREQARLSLGEASEAQLNTLRQGAERYQGKKVGYAYAQQYAALLAVRGRTEEAADFLKKQLELLPLGEGVARDDFRLLLGLISGARRADGRTALEGLLARAGELDLQRVALHLLARDAADAAFYSKLNGLIMAAPPHPILADLLLVRAQLALTEKQVQVVEKSGALDTVVAANLAQVEVDAKALLAKFPASELKPASLGLLADQAWELKRYRTAADYAALAQAELPQSEVRASLGVMIAEARFKAGDFNAAEKAYAAALDEVPVGVDPGLLIAQRVVSLIQAGQLDGAIVQLDRFAQDARLGLVQRWQVEWVLSSALQAAGRESEAYARVNQLVAGTNPEDGGLSGELRARLAWLQARLSLVAGQPEKTLELAAAIPRQLTGVAADLRAQVEAGIRLMQAQAKFRLGQSAEALAALASVRADFPQADAAVYSFIDEADYYAGKGLYVDAQKCLIDLADKFKQHEYAPYALDRAALIVEQRGEDQYYEEAYKILERIVSARDYAQSPIIFHARLKQGDLARRLNDFPRARLTYEFLINNYGHHSGVLAAELALAACHRAQITPSDVSHYESALTILERLQDLPSASVDMRVEAGFQLGDLLATKGKAAELDRAEIVWWTLATTYLLDDVQVEKLGTKGRYWIARALVRFGDLRRARGNLEEARNAYELIIRKKLPFAKLARESFIRAGGQSLAEP
jgi:tetratricopeptide (TPR) repeat protein